MDYGKFKYEQAKKERQQRRKQQAATLKGIRLTPSTDDHDLMTKVKMARRFVEEGAKVKVTIVFRGRMITHQEFGVRMMEKITAELQEVAKVEIPAHMEGPRMMTLMLVRK